MSHTPPDQAKARYNVLHWGGGYFNVNEAGHLVAQPAGNAKQSIDMTELVARLRDAGATLPVLVRFNDILRDRLDRLRGSFAKTMQDEGYSGGYTAVYPIKVNQQSSVLRTLVDHGAEGFGLEAGSKSELLAVIGLSRPGGVIVCNGYKDREYIRLALAGQQLGHRVYIVLEKISELELIIDEARRLKLQPRIGVRVKLASIGAGNWQNTGGEKSKFGLSSASILEATQRLREAGMGDSLRLLHFHLGSQIANIRDIQRGLLESARYYAELRRLGVPVDTIDVGGGLGIDYEGTRSRSFCSINYTLQEYANNVVSTIHTICDENGLPHPHIISESGRALTAHHAVLITNVIDVTPAMIEIPQAAPAEDAPWALHHLWSALQGLDLNSPMETYHESAHCLAEAQSMFNHGLLSIEQRAAAESIYTQICKGLLVRLNPNVRAHREALDELQKKLTYKFFCNFSLFQSTPDVWGIEQIFPLMPLQRLHEAPNVRAVIEDITCDSDGRIDHYVNEEGIDDSLPLHLPNPGEEYLLGVFLVGAYQEILGDMHNLFGDTDSADVHLQSTGYVVDNLVRGNTTRQLLEYVNIAPEELLDRYRAKLAKAELTNDAGLRLLADLESGLDGYTYLEE